MSMMWRFACDGDGCEAVEIVPQFNLFPVGWLHRTVSDRIESLDEPATGTGFPSGRSELSRQFHYCPTCRRRVGAAKL
jgi:hypothetical protein